MDYYWMREIIQREKESYENHGALNKSDTAIPKAKHSKAHTQL